LQNRLTWENSFSGLPVPGSAGSVFDRIWLWLRDIASRSARRQNLTFWHSRPAAPVPGDRAEVTARNSASGTNPLISPQGLATVARMLADGTITARIRSTAELDDADQILAQLRAGTLGGKAVIRI
jgi:hypothetical protein